MRTILLILMCLVVSGCGDGKSVVNEQDPAKPDCADLPSSDEGIIHSSQSASIEIPNRFLGVWAIEPYTCAQQQVAPLTTITKEGFRREEIWGEAQQIRSILADGTKMHLTMGYQYETVEMYLYDSHWILSDDDMRLSIVETNLWERADHHEDPSEEFIRCS